MTELDELETLFINFGIYFEGVQGAEANPAEGSEGTQFLTASNDRFYFDDAGRYLGVYDCEMADWTPRHE